MFNVERSFRAYKPICQRVPPGGLQRKTRLGGQSIKRPKINRVSQKAFTKKFLKEKTFSFPCLGKNQYPNIWLDYVDNQRFITRTRGRVSALGQQRRLPFALRITIESLTQYILITAFSRASSNSCIPPDPLGFDGVGGYWFRCLFGISIIYI